MVVVDIDAAVSPAADVEAPDVVGDEAAVATTSTSSSPPPPPQRRKSYSKTTTKKSSSSSKSSSNSRKSKSSSSSRGGTTGGGHRSSTRQRHHRKKKRRGGRPHNLHCVDDDDCSIHSMRSTFLEPIEEVDNETLGSASFHNNDDESSNVSCSSLLSSVFLPSSSQQQYEGNNNSNNSATLSDLKVWQKHHDDDDKNSNDKKESNNNSSNNNKDDKDIEQGNLDETSDSSSSSSTSDGEATAISEYLNPKEEGNGSGGGGGYFEALLRNKKKFLIIAIVVLVLVLLIATIGAVVARGGSGDSGNVSDSDTATVENNPGSSSSTNTEPPSSSDSNTGDSTGTSSEEDQATSADDVSKEDTNNEQDPKTDPPAPETSSSGSDDQDPGEEDDVSQGEGGDDEHQQQQPTDKPDVVAPTEPPEVFSSIYINAGGSLDEFIDPDGNTWYSDEMTTYHGDSGSLYDGCPEYILNTLSDSLYCSERFFDRGKGPGLYEIPVPPDDYQVVLHFAETYHADTDSRFFNIVVEGNMVAEEYDIYKAAGGDFIATQVFAEVTVEDGSLSIELLRVPSGKDPKINAIEVHKLSEARDPESYQIIEEYNNPIGIATESPTGQDSEEAEDYGDPDDSTESNNPDDTEEIPTEIPTEAPEDIDNSGTEDEGQQDSQTPGGDSDETEDSTGTEEDGSQSGTEEENEDPATETPEAEQGTSSDTEVEDSPTAFSPLLINSGGANFGVWESDWRYSEYLFGDGRTYEECPSNITGTDLDELFCTERWFSTPGGYELPVPNGRYKVLLQFAEIFEEEAGARLFDLEVEGVLIRSSFDIFAAAHGSFIATTLTAFAEVTDGFLTIELRPLVGNAKINGFEIYAEGSS